MDLTPLTLTSINTDVQDEDGKLTNQRISQQNGLDDLGPESDNDDLENIDKMRNQLLQQIKETPSSPDTPHNSPGLLSPCSESFHDTNTQMSLVEVSSKLNLEENTMSNMASDVETTTNTLWGMVETDQAEGLQDFSRKARKSSRKSDAASRIHSEVDEEPDVFDARGAISTSHFLFSKFGAGVPIFTQGKSSNESVISTPSVITTTATPISAASFARTSQAPTVNGGVFLAPQQPATVRRGASKVKKNYDATSLNIGHPSSCGGIELKILSQPEENHRARYMTEGSRGAIKDRTGNGSPEIQLLGWNRPVTVQIFIGTDTGKVKPHGFYQACRVAGKNCTPCTERDIEGTTVIEIQLDPAEGMKASIDCVGILKLRNADVEQRIGIARSKKKSTRARVVFRVTILQNDGNCLTLQTASSPISCTQPAGLPEICRKSLDNGSPAGGSELFVIGKNFLKGTKVMFQEKDCDDKIVWRAEAEIEQEYFQQNHLICRVPEYQHQDITEPAVVEIIVHCATRISEPVQFTYMPKIGEPFKQNFMSYLYKLSQPSSTLML